MAEVTDCHAAGRPFYELREFSGSDPALDLGARHEFPDYLAAVEYAFEYLGRNDPLRSGTVSRLDVVRVDGTRRETVWTYSHDEESEEGDLVGRWGYDPTSRWRTPTTVVTRPTPLRRAWRPVRPS
jgi:hypothetical protein